MYLQVPARIAHSADVCFDLQFEGMSNEVFNGVSLKAGTISASIRSFSLLYPSTADKTSETLPYVTMDDFEVFAKSARITTGASLITYTPSIDGQMNRFRPLWEQYAVENQDWIQRGHELDSSHKHSELDVYAPIFEEIWRFDVNRTIESDPGPRPSSPIWQMSPPPMNTSIVNFNLLSDYGFSEMIGYARETGEAVLSAPLDVANLTGLPSADGPQSVLVQPVFAGVESTSSSIVGNILAVVPWTTFFSSVSTASNRAGVGV